MGHRLRLLFYDLKNGVWICTVLYHGVPDPSYVGPRARREVCHRPHWFPGSLSLPTRPEAFLDFRGCAQKCVLRVTLPFTPTQPQVHGQSVPSPGPDCVTSPAPARRHCLGRAVALGTPAISLRKPHCPLPFPRRPHAPDTGGRRWVCGGVQPRERGLHSE